MIIPIALLARLVSMDVCAATAAPPSMDGSEAVVVGQLVFSRHSADLFEVRDSGRCIVFTVFPGTPAFMTPGVTDQETRRDARLGKFVSEYYDYSHASPMTPKSFAITGRLKVKQDFKIYSTRRGNGYGYQGLSRVALIVIAIDEIPPNKTSGQ